MQKTAKAVQLFEVTQFDATMQQMGAIIVETAAITNEAVPLPRPICQNATRLNTVTERVIQLEGQADDTHNKGLKTLFLGSKDHAMDFIVGSEIYDRPEHLVDRFEDVANQISSIVVAHL